MRSSVVLPEPLEPMSACVAPLGTLRLTSVSTNLPSKVFVMFCNASMESVYEYRARLLVCLDEGTLVIQHLPSGGGVAPKRGTAGDPLSLMQGVGNQIIIRGDFPALEIARQPFRFLGIRRSVLQRIQHELPAVAPARGAHFPEIRIGHGLVVPARCAEFRMVKDGLAQLQFLEDGEQLRRGHGRDARPAWVLLIRQKTLLKRLREDCLRLYDSCALIASPCIGVSMDLGIRGRTAIVCASSQGLGKGCALALAEAGVALVINGRNQTLLEQTAEEIRQAWSVSVTPVLADVSTPEGQAALLKACPTPDILINNNAGPPLKNFRELDRQAILSGVTSNMVTP